MAGIENLFGAQAPQNQPVTNLPDQLNTRDIMNSQNQLRQAQTDTAVQDMQAKQRQMQLSMLSGVLNEPDPEKQRQILGNIVPIANKINPSYQIDPNIDLPTLRALVQSTRPAENLPPSGLDMSGFSPVIKAGLQSGQVSLKDVLTAQSTNPFLNVGGGSGGAPSATSSIPAAGDYSSAISQLPPQMQPTVKAIIEGREMPPNPNSRAPGAAALIQAVNAVDPTFDFTNAAKRQSTAKDFASGGSANSVTSLNTLAGHLGSLEKAWSGLNNSAGITPFSNTISSLANQAEAGTGQSGSLKSFNIAKSAVSDELSKLLKGGVVSDTEKKEWEAAIDNGASPEAQKAALNEISGIIESRLDALNNKYHEGMGPVNVSKNWATPQSQAVFNRLQGRTASSQLPAQMQPGGAAAQLPSQMQPKPQESGLQPNSIVRSKNGIPFIYLGGDPTDQKSYKPVSEGNAGDGN